MLPPTPLCRLLFLKLMAQNERERFAFCSVKGCERIKIKALIPQNAGISDCSATAYPRFTERATVDVPMPRKLVGAQLVSEWQAAACSLALALSLALAWLSSPGGMWGGCTGELRVMATLWAHT